MPDPLIDLARKAVGYYLENKEKLPVSEVMPEVFKKRAGVFVSLYSQNNILRGCIGTYLPYKKNLAEEIIANAISAAFRDSRFEPLRKNELENLKISVDVLSKPEPIKKISELDPKKYGVVVKSADGKSGLLLPDLEGINTPQTQIAIACQKASISTENDAIFLYRFTVDRHKE